MKKLKPGDEIKGIFSSSKNRYGFIVYDDEGSDLFVPPDYSMGALDGDEVSAIVFEDARRKNGEICAKVISINKRGFTEYTGTVSLTGRPGRFRNMQTVIPSNVKLNLRQNIVYSDVYANEGDLVRVKIITYPDAYGEGECEIIENYGRAGSREANYKAILFENGIELEFSEKVLREAEISSKKSLSTEGREDLRDNIIFTIDGEGAKDLDDAISIEKDNNGGYILGVHIADVSEYVPAGSECDREAMKRGTSVYFVDKVVPMLPVYLSNGSCSLNTGEDKYALSVFINFDKNGEMTGYRVCESIINSKIRGVYSELNDILANGELSEYYEKYEMLFPDVFPTMFSLYKILEKRASARGATDFETPEPEITLDKNGFPIIVENRERGESERLIEQFMVSANCAVAKYLGEHGLPGVYRVHEKPPEDKVRAFKDMMNNMGINASALDAENPRGEDYADVLDRAERAGIKKVVSYLMLRSMAKANYSPQPIGHFGLALCDYCHFTSPIRRYPDLSVHRIIKKYLHSELDSKIAVNAMKKFAAKSAKLSTENELRAINAERAIEDLYIALYMSDRIGKEYDAVITSVTPHGFYAELENGCEGLCRIEELEGRFEYNERRMSLVSNNASFSLGENVRIRVSEVAVSEGKVFFVVPGFISKKINEKNTQKHDIIKGKKKLGLKSVRNMKKKSGGKRRRKR